MGASNVCVVLLIGIPSSGKTTFCKEFLELNNEGFQTTLIHYDDLMEDYTSSSRKIIYENVRHLVEGFIRSHDKHVIIVDDNFYYKSMRQEFINLSKEFQIGCFQIFFQIDLKFALERNALRPNRVPDDIIKQMYEKIEVPKGNFFLINSNEPFNPNLRKEFLKYVNSAFCNPMQVVGETPKVIPSQLHNIDLILRRIVGEYIQRKKFDPCYNIVRKTVYNNIKKGNIRIDNLKDEDLYQYLSSFFVFFD